MTCDDEETRASVNQMTQISKKDIHEWVTEKSRQTPMAKRNISLNSNSETRLKKSKIAVSGLLRKAIGLVMKVMKVCTKSPVRSMRVLMRRQSQDFQLASVKPGLTPGHEAYSSRSSMESAKK